MKNKTLKSILITLSMFWIVGCTTEANSSDIIIDNTITSESVATAEQDISPTATPDPTPEPEIIPSATPDPTDAPAQSISSEDTNTLNTEDQKTTYVLNTNSKKVHYPSCRSVDKIKLENMATTDKSIEELLNEGYTKCGNCWK